jgi:DNA polymerase-3 subunit epsilon
MAKWLDKLTGKQRGAGATSRPKKVDYRSAVALGYTYVAVDVETTGLDPKADRIVEIAAVKFDSHGTVLEEWSTLVNPGSTDAGPTHIHGIEGDWLAAAPTFEDIAGDLGSRLIGSYPVSHNTDFDWSFIEKEYERIGFELGGFNTACTLDVARALGLPGRLGALAAELDIQQSAAHTALDDARVTAKILAHILPMVDRSTFEGASAVTASDVPPVAPSGKAVHRREAASDTKVTSWMSDAIDRLPARDASSDRDPHAASAYLDLLARTMDDGVLLPSEREALLSRAEESGLSTADLQELHDEFFAGLVDVALEDNKVTQEERKELDRAAGWLGVTDLDAAVKTGRARRKELAAAKREKMQGKIVAFTGAGLYNKDVRQALAEKHGMEYRSRVRADVELLVIGKATVDNQTVASARALEIPVIVEPAFWDSLGV